jgi:hypothetical protein
MKKTFLLVTVLLMLLPLAARGEQEAPAYDLGVVAVSAPDGYDVFVRGALTEVGQLQYEYDMDYIQDYFDAFPELYLDAFNPVLGHDLMVILVPIDTTANMSEMSDYLTEKMVVPGLTAEYEKMGAVVSEMDVVTVADVTYVHILATVSTEEYEQYMEAYYTAKPSDGVGYGVTIKVAAYNTPVTQGMSADLAAMVETAVYDAD